MEGQIFNIQPFSIHDGPGIRTTVFLKGCPLRCSWCSNPESGTLSPSLFHDSNKCLACGTCAAACGSGAIHFSKGKILFDRQKCTECFACAQVCPTRSFYMDSKSYELNELVCFLLKDKLFFDVSGGGVTLSGGEPFFQKEFCLALLKELKKNGIHTVVETCGYVAPETLSAAMPYVDLFYFDLKHLDPNIHKAFTGTDNRLILENLTFLTSCKKDLVLRIPVIPGVNLDAGVMNEYAALCQKLHIGAVHLLPFHQYGSRKYKMLGLPYPFEQYNRVEESALQAFVPLFTRVGTAAQIGG